MLSQNKWSEANLCSTRVFYGKQGSVPLPTICRKAQKAVHMNLSDRIAVMARLGRHLLEAQDEYLEAVIQRTAHYNPWFTKENQWQALRAIAEKMLDAEALSRWAQHYNVADAPTAIRVGLVMAGNIPLVGFQDVLCTFIAGHRAQIKLSEKDPYLLPYLLQLLASWAPQAAEFFDIVERLSGFDAVIATGSNNSARYFHAYFGQYPHIIRRNRNSVAVLSGCESDEMLHTLGQDIFSYFGLGCRNVSKLYLPRGYDVKKLLEVLHEYRQLILHEKYKHNFDYNFALLTLNKTPFHFNGCVIMKEDPAFDSRIAMLHYEYYDSLPNVTTTLHTASDKIQVVVSQQLIPELKLPVVPFGQSQQPGLFDYPDGVDTMAFLTALRP